jgi:hypothetical protein
MPSLSVYLSSCDCYGEVLLHVTSCVVGCRVMIRCCALGPLWVVRVSSMDRAFKPVGKRCVCPSRSWVYSTVAVVPSITRSLMFC